MRKLVVFLIFVLAVVVAADRGLHYAAQNEIAKRISGRYEMAAEPEVTIAGFPFLNQAFSGEYQRIRVVTGALTIQEVQLERVDATLREVDAPIGDLMTRPKVTANSVDASVLLPYSELQKRLPEGIVIETENGTPRITGDLAMGQFSAPVESDLDVSVDESGIVHVSPSNLEAGDAPIDLGSAQDRLTLSFEIPPLPFGLRITDIEALPNGVQLTGNASDVSVVGDLEAQK
ncbi:LmeA family phospholipid-binding protein [Salinactinospora qingdaonensis]|uniref:DUF2993 domain-containing protein n=1 Tax=Salinactinospora qingdaonensis TaxID=702744 RepID=A0ABP7F258_9ACTN